MEEKINECKKTIKLYEESIDSEIGKRVEKVLKDQNQLQKDLREQATLNKEKDEHIEKLKFTVAKRDETIAALNHDKKQGVKTNEQLEYAKKHLESKVSTFRGQTEEKLKEIDNLYEENDRIKAKLSYISQKYNFDQIDRDKEMLSLYDQWIGRA